MDNELQSLLEGIETASELSPYEEGIVGDVAKLAGNAVKNAATNVKNAVGNKVKQIGSNIQKSVATAQANLQNKQNVKNQQQVSTEADQKLQDFAMKVSKLLTQGANGDLQKTADKSQKNANDAKAAAKQAQKESDDAKAEGAQV